MNTASATSNLAGISSMATRQVLAELVTRWQADGGMPITIESVGGVDAARRVQDGGEAFDVVFLASDAIDRLSAAGFVVAGSKVDLMVSGTALAVRAGNPAPAIASEADVRAAVLAASRIGVSTGPSGVALLSLFERWGITAQIDIVQACPGVPVASLVASGEVALGFQQLSELIHVAGIDIVGPLPKDIAIDTVFSAGVVTGSAHVADARRLLSFLASPAADEAKRRQGMQPIGAATAQHQQVSA